MRRSELLLLSAVDLLFKELAMVPRTYGLTAACEKFYVAKNYKK